MTITRREAIGAGAVAIASAPVFARAAPRRDPFLWGVATAAHVSEGNNVNSDYWVLENIEHSWFREPSGDANDSFERWPEDLALIRAGGMNSYRFSVEWARIEPERGHFSAAMLAHYRRICVACREAGIEPVVTFHHFTSPRWVAALGGWENPLTAELFARYCEVTTKALGDTIRWACTINEPNAQVNSWVMAGEKASARAPLIVAEAARAIGSDRFGAFFMGDAFKVRDVCIDGHVRARTAIKSVAPHIKVGLPLALQDLVAAPGGEALLKRLYDTARTPFYEAAKADDFIGVQGYNRLTIGPNGYLPATAARYSDMGHADASPDVIVVVAKAAHGATGVPVFVTEHGINTADDTFRVRHMRESIGLLAEATDGGLPVVGYMHFTLNDTFEWSSGYIPRFGMVAVDRATLRRTPRPSLAAYRRLIGAMRRGHRWA